MTAVGPEMELIVILIMSHWRNLEISPLQRLAETSVYSPLYLGNVDISHFSGKVFNAVHNTMLLCWS